MTSTTPPMPRRRSRASRPRSRAPNPTRAAPPPRRASRPPETITEAQAHELAQRMAREDEADRVQGHNTAAPEHEIRANYHSMSRQTKAAQEAAWLLQAHIDRFEARRIDRQRLHRATTRQWSMRYWLVRNADTDRDGTETVEGGNSHLWDTDLDGYLSTDTHNGRTDERLLGQGPLRPRQRASQTTPASDAAIFIDDGDTNSSTLLLPCEPQRATSEEHTDPDPTHDGPFHTSPQPPDDDSKPAATDASTLEPAAEPATADSSAPTATAARPPASMTGATAATATSDDAPATEDPARPTSPQAPRSPTERPRATPARRRADPSLPPNARAKAHALPARPRPAPHHQADPSSDHASGTTLPAPPPPHPDIQTAPCTTPGCGRPGPVPGRPVLPRLRHCGRNRRGTLPLPGVRCVSPRPPTRHGRR